ncbi:MAG: hypothetical protein KatS3mg068_0606 [Candidatus Sericytochromatia bacterium]|nr:MAG: hypothetical protein KatS3mg068_0606 [Candidatus Sericytochromatia bacterium]
MSIIFYMNYYPWLFKERLNLYNKKYERIPLLDLPFSYKDFDKVVFYDEITI